MERTFPADLQLQLEELKVSQSEEII